MADGEAVQFHLSWLVGSKAASAVYGGVGRLRVVRSDITGDVCRLDLEKRFSAFLYSVIDKTIFER